MKTISRSQGRSATAAAAYRSGEHLHDDRQGIVFDYRRKEHIRNTAVFAPDGTPPNLLDRATLWNTAEAAEKRRDALVARELELALPRELTHGQQAALVSAFINEQIVSRGLIADVAIHDATADDGREQPHVHVLFNDRAVDPDEPTALARRKTRDFNRRDGIEALRQAWESHANRALETAGRTERIDRRSLADQRQAAAFERQTAEATAEAEGRSPDEDPTAAEAAARETEASRPAETKAGPAARALARRGRPSVRWSAVQRTRRIRARVRTLAENVRQAAAEARTAAEEARATATTTTAAEPALARTPNPTRTTPTTSTSSTPTPDRHPSPDQHDAAPSRAPVRSSSPKPDRPHRRRRRGREPD